MEEIEKLDKAIKQTRASILLDNLPLSDLYVENYRNERIKEIKNNSSKLILKRGVLNGKGRK